MWQPSPPDSNKLYCQSHFQTLVLQNLPLKSMVSSLLLETGIFRTSRSSGNRGPKEKKRKGYVHRGKNRREAVFWTHGRNCKPGANHITRYPAPRPPGTVARSPGDERIHLKAELHVTSWYVFRL